MRLTYAGHSTFLLETAGARIVLDPFFDENPASPFKVADVACDYIIISHGHSDHCCDALALAQRTGATIIANHEIAEYFAHCGAKTHGLNPGGGHDFPFGRVALTPAIHSSSFDFIGAPPHPYAGVACGILLRAGERTLYHAGDTALFSDMRLIGDAGLDAALLPIGDNYTMGPDDALRALPLLRPRLTVPMHYNTWPPIAQDAAGFARRALEHGHDVRVLAPGAWLEI
jgi:L-ascorbate metabolism protein UlaG (beta-lactamase superfamily)